MNIKDVQRIMRDGFPIYVEVIDGCVVRITLIIKSSYTLVQGLSRGRCMVSIERMAQASKEGLIIDVDDKLYLKGNTPRPISRLIALVDIRNGPAKEDSTTIGIQSDDLLGAVKVWDSNNGYIYHLYRWKAEECIIDVWNMFCDYYKTPNCKIEV